MNRPPRAPEPRDLLREDGRVAFFLHNAQLAVYRWKSGVSLRRWMENGSGCGGGRRLSRLCSPSSRLTRCSARLKETQWADEGCKKRSKSLGNPTANLYVPYPPCENPLSSCLAKAAHGQYSASHEPLTGHGLDSSIFWVTGGIGCYKVQVIHMETVHHPFRNR